MAERLRTSGSVQLDVAGRGALAFTVPPFTAWKITRVSLSIPSPAAIPLCKMYRSAESPDAFIDGTSSGDGDSGDFDETFLAGESLLLVWTDGGAGDVATAQVTGEVL